MDGSFIKALIMVASIIMVESIIVLVWGLTVIPIPNPQSSGSKVFNYKDPLTGCEYLYTRSSDLTPRESGDGINQLGCYNNNEGVLM